MKQITGSYRELVVKAAIVVQRTDNLATSSTTSPSSTQAVIMYRKPIQHVLPLAHNLWPTGAKASNFKPLSGYILPHTAQDAEQSGITNNLTNYILNAWASIHYRRQRALWGWRG